jgi:hypothetical protein
VISGRAHETNSPSSLRGAPRDIAAVPELTVVHGGHGDAAHGNLRQDLRRFQLFGYRPLPGLVVVFGLHGDAGAVAGLGQRDGGCAVSGVQAHPCCTALWQ